MIFRDIRNISRWCAKNSLLINPDKTKLVVIGSAQLLKRLPHISLSLLGKTVSPVSFSSPVPLPDLYFDSFSYPVAPIVSSAGGIV